MTPPTPDVRRPRLRLRRNPTWLLAGVLAVCLGGLASAYLFMSAAASEQVLRTNRTIYRGEVVAAADLSVVSVGGGAGLRTIPAGDLDSLIGQVALVDLPGGSLVVSDAVGDGGLAGGESRVGVRLEAGRYPTGLLPGTAVLVVALPADGLATDAAALLPASVPATLVAAPAAQPDGSVVVDLTLAADQAEAVSRLAAAGRVTLVEQQEAGR